MTVRPSVCPAALQWSTGWQPWLFRQRPTTLSEQQTRKLSLHQEAKLGSAVECFLTFQTFLCTSRWEPSPSLSHPIRRLITSLSCSLERGCDQRPKERKKERRRRRKKQALILFQVTFLITAKNPESCRGMESRHLVVKQKKNFVAHNWKSRRFWGAEVLNTFTHSYSNTATI